MKVSSREFQRRFRKIKEAAKKGECVYVMSEGEQYLFHVVRPRPWRGLLAGKAEIKGDLFTTGLHWESGQ